MAHYSSTNNETSSQSSASNEVRQLQLQKQELLDATRDQAAKINLLLAKASGGRGKAISEKILSHMESIAISARKYGTMDEMYLCQAAFNEPRPVDPVDPMSSSRYTTSATEDSALVEELYRAFVEAVHALFNDPAFVRLVRKELWSAQSDQLLKVRSVIDEIFVSYNIPIHIVRNARANRSHPDLYALLGIDPENPTVIPELPNILFPEGRVGDLRYLGGNWELFARIAKVMICGPRSLAHEGPGANNSVSRWNIVEVSPGFWANAMVKAVQTICPSQKFYYDGTSDYTEYEWPKLHYRIKSHLVRNWSKPYIQRQIRHANAFIFGTGSLNNNSTSQSLESIDIDNALANLNMDDMELSDDEDAAPAPVAPAPAATSAPEPVQVVTPALAPEPAVTSSPVRPAAAPAVVSTPVPAVAPALVPVLAPAAVTTPTTTAAPALVAVQAPAAAAAPASAFVRIPTGGSISSPIAPFKLASLLLPLSTPVPPPAVAAPILLASPPHAAAANASGSTPDTNDVAATQVATGAKRKGNGRKRGQQADPAAINEEPAEMVPATRTRLQTVKRGGRR
ncbi:hypothetical protein CONPUDRAFT_156631 [Coniophora puteana RWD-64-598 SS2]|uniref:Uncharacterized protein n=1 Tax=Coniophora puteana (strain RWD-64-598) TaxID=741705 RepID=A0A5M3MJ48_CONPW|nr:uncharacterized protein CONPUDRAFT_156631 [Coniophora puteana RWD-64-598 SS2]EIW78665.1 hypothetical protein CONPUDRAFT_156631 [Coniophora puteana RWD-64-598 SS2]